jgi:chromosome segregation ATPase
MAMLNDELSRLQEQHPNCKAERDSIESKIGIIIDELGKKTEEREALNEEYLHIKARCSDLETKISQMEAVREMELAKLRDSFLARITGIQEASQALIVNLEAKCECLSLELDKRAREIEILKEQAEKLPRHRFG